MYEFDITGKAFRALTADIAEGISAGIRDGGRRFHAVFPPGADRVGLISSVMSATRWKTVIVTPNAARRAYWQTRRVRQADLYDAAASTWSNIPGPLVSANPFSCAPVLTLNYAQLFASRAGGQEQEALRRFLLHAERQGYALIVFDECASLPDTWSAEIREGFRAAGAAIIGIDSQPQGEPPDWSRYCREGALSDIPVSLAALQGALAPYRHQVYFQSISGKTDDPERVMQSSSKIDAALEIIAREVRMHGAEARIALLMDSPALTHLRSGGLLDGASILTAIAGRPDLAAHPAAMFTGASVIVPAAGQADVVAAMQREIQLHGWDIALHIRSGESVSEISAEGRDWNSAAYVEIVSGLFRKGLAGCAVLAPEVLSWGIEKLPFNTVIDLTSGARGHYVHIPEHPKEVAVSACGATVNYWDVVCLSPTGGADWRRFLEKHTATECPTEEGILEIGLGAVDMRLPAINTAVLAENVDAWNAAQLERAVHRKDWAGVWKRVTSSGAPAQTAVLEPWDAFPARVHCEAAFRDQLAHDARVYASRKASIKLHHTLWTVAVVSGGLIAFLTQTREMGLYISGGAVLFLIGKVGTKWWSVRGARPRPALVSREAFLLRTAHACYAAYRDSVEAAAAFPPPVDVVKMVVREDGSCRVWFDLPDAKMAGECLEAFMALFTAQNESGYALAVYAFDAGKKRLSRILAAKDRNAFLTPHYLVPVPEFFAQSRAHVEVFRVRWEEYVGHAAVYHSPDALPDAPPFREALPVSVRVAWHRR